MEHIFRYTVSIQVSPEEFEVNPTKSQRDLNTILFQAIEHERQEGALSPEGLCTDWVTVTDAESCVDELYRLRVDAGNIRRKFDPNEVDTNWTGFVQGINTAIHRMEMFEAHGREVRVSGRVNQRIPNKVE